MSNRNHIKEKRSPTRRGRGCIVWLGGLLAGVLLLIVAGAIYEPIAEARDAQAHPPPGQMVDVGGYRLHINCTGTGSPTVVIDAGLGDWSTSWSFVQAEVAKTTRACTYDRAGLGWSEAGPLPRDARQFARELNALLHNANIPGPYVLAGHSLGGLPVRVFVHDYPAEVAGIVLIDSMHPGQSKRSAADANTQATTQTHALPVLPTLARLGIVRLLGQPLAGAVSVPEDQKAYNSRFVLPQSVQEWADESRALPDSLAQAGAVTTFGDLPLIVLSRGLDLDPAWQAGQAELFQLSSNSEHLIAEQSDHNIAFNQPGAAVAALVKMIEQLRK